jgi:cell division protein FtsB
VSAATTTARPARTPAAPRTSLAVVPRPRPKAARGAFVLLLLALLVGGLMLLLALNTALAQDSFVVQDLQHQQAQLDDQQQQLMQQVAVLESPEALASKARAIGMIPGGRPTFLRLDAVAPATSAATKTGPVAKQSTVATAQASR